MSLISWLVQYREQPAAVDADPEHEVLVLQLLRLQHGGAAARDALRPLGVQPVPPEAAAQVRRVDAGEAPAGVDVDDPLPNGKAVVVLLDLLVLVQRLAVA